MLIYDLNVMINFEFTESINKNYRVGIFLIVYVIRQVTNIIA